MTQQTLTDDEIVAVHTGAANRVLSADPDTADSDADGADKDADSADADADGADKDADAADSDADGADKDADAADAQH